jgi:hypothetical protein
MKENLLICRAWTFRRCGESARRREYSSGMGNNVPGWEIMSPGLEIMPRPLQGTFQPVDSVSVADPG